jgi:voltage-gated sodium channel
MTKLQTILESAGVRKFITAVILFNAVILGLETSDMVMARAGGLIGVLDRMCLAIFVLELALKLSAYRLRFFRDGWNIFDFAIVAVSLVPAAQSLSVLRSLRILRLPHF